MSEPQFRQERKKIDPTEFGQSNPNTMEQVHNFRKNAGMDTANVIPLEEDGGVTITGAMPPAIQQMLQKRPSAQPTEMPMPPPRESMTLVNTGNDALDALLAGVSNLHNYRPVNLPSNSKFYSNIPATLHVRPMTGREEQYLATQRMGKNNSATNMIFKSCIREKIDVSKLLVEDRTYLLIFLRGISYSNLYDINIKCPDCGTSFEESIDLNSLSVLTCDDNFNEDDLTGVLPMSQYKFQYRLPTGEDEVNIAEYSQKRQKQFPDGLDDTFFYRASKLLKYIGNDEVSISSATPILTLLPSMPVADINYLRNKLTDAPFGVKTDVEIVCKNCMYVFEATLPMELSFFFPKNKEEVEE